MRKTILDARTFDNLQHVGVQKGEKSFRDLFHFDEVLRMFPSKKNHSLTHDERIVYVLCPCESLFSVEGVYAKWGANKLQEVNIFCLRK